MSPYDSSRNTGNFRGNSSYSRQSYQQRDNRSNVIEDIIKAVPKFMSDQEDPNGVCLIKNAERLGDHLANENKMTTAQIRKIFSETKKTRFNNNGPYELNLLKAKLAYTAGRYREVRDFRRVLDEIINEIGTDEKKFKRFQDFFEAVVAYHRSYGGKE